MSSLAATAFLCGAGLLTAGCGSGNGRGGRDAGRDAGLVEQDAGPARDAGTDAGRADSGIQMRNAGSFGDVGGTLTIYDDRPCEEWAEPGSRLPRGLPADSTPRQLWLWHPYEDPVYQETGLFNQLIQYGATVGVDGTLWIVGPEPTRVEALERTGHLRWISQPDHPVAGPVTALPDGDAAIAVRGDLAILAVLAPEGGAGTILDLPFRYPEEAFAPSPTIVAVGPHGRLYTSFRRELVASCKTDRLLWRLQWHADGHDDERTVAVSPEGHIFLAGDWSSHVVEVSADGDILSAIPPLPDTLDIYRTAARTGPSESLVTYARSGLRLDEHWAEVWSGTSVLYTLPTLDGPTDYAVDPLGAVWALRRRSLEYVRYVDGVETWTAGDGLGAGIFVWGEDGSRIGPWGTPSVSMQRIGPDGVARWTVPMHGHNAELYVWPEDGLSFDDQGVVYAQARDERDNNYIIAVQTDVLPPAEPGCWIPRCNARRNGWMASP